MSIKAQCSTSTSSLLTGMYINCVALRAVPVIANKCHNFIFNFLAQMHKINNTRKAFSKEKVKGSIKMIKKKIKAVRSSELNDPYMYIIMLMRKKIIGRLECFKKEI